MAEIQIKRPITSDTTPQCSTKEQTAPTHLQSMEDVQSKAFPYFSQVSMERPFNPINNATDKVYEEIISLSDQIRQEKGIPPIEKRSVVRQLHTMLARVSCIVERHLFRQTETSYQKKLELSEDIETIKTWTQRQGGSCLVAGIGTPLLLMIGSLIGGPIEDAVKMANSLVSTASRGFESAAESFKIGPNFKMQQYSQDTAADQRALEELKSLPRRFLETLIQLARAELDSVRATGSK